MMPLVTLTCQKCGGRERKRRKASMQFIPKVHFCEYFVNNTGLSLAEITQEGQLFY